jgi:hypothetical protein
VQNLLKQNISSHIPKIEKLFRIMTQKTHVALQRRMIDNLSKTADQRYLDFIEKNPQLFQRLTNLQIAAYLGISHEFLSKIRKKLAGKLECNYLLNWLIDFDNNFSFYPTSFQIFQSFVSLLKRKNFINNWFYDSSFNQFSNFT